MNDIKTSNRKSRWALGLLPVLVAGWIGLTPLAASAHPWVVGNVYTAISNGQYQQYSPAGAPADLLQPGTIGRPDGGFTAGCAFNPAGNPPVPVNLYTTVWHENKVVVMADGATHPISATINTGLVSPGHPETIVFNTAGDFFVGLVDAPVGQANLLKYSKANVLLGKWELTRGGRGVDAIDLDANGTTIYYTSEDNVIRKFDILTTSPGGGTGTQGIFYTGAASSRFYGLRVLQGGNTFGAGGNPGFMMVADTTNIKVLSETSPTVVNTYGDGGVAPVSQYGPGWFSVSIDAGGSSFVAGDFYSGQVVKFNADKTIANQFIANPLPFRVNGVCVRGELTVGVVPFPKVGFFVVGDLSAGMANPGGFSNPPAANTVTLQDTSWRNFQNISGGNDVNGNAFKGFAEKTVPATPNCGDHWSSKGGNSGGAAPPVGSKIAVIVTRHVLDAIDKADGVINAIILVNITVSQGTTNGLIQGTVIEVICSL